MTSPSNAAANLAIVVPLASEPTEDKLTVKERCQRRYGFYHSDLMLAVDQNSGKVTIKANAVNYRVILANMQNLDLAYSVFEQCELINGRPMTDMDILKARDQLIRIIGVNVAKQDVCDAMDIIADARKYNPLEAWFRGLPPSEGRGYLDRWLFDVCGTPETPINRILGRKWLISAVARALEPGCYVEGSLIFYGGQAVGKSWLFKNLNPKPSYYSGEELNISNKKEAAALCAGKFIIELGELNSIRKNELNAMKQYLTEQSDTYQPKYKQKAVTIQRMHIFGGSTNEETFLTDPTGNRRFWCVAAGEEVNQKLFLAIKEQLWAEALAAFDAGEEWTLSKDERAMLEEANAPFMVEDPLVVFLKETLNNDPRVGHKDVISSYELLNVALSSYKERVHPKALAVAMQALGWKKGQISSGKNKGDKAYFRPIRVGWGEESME